MCLQSLYRHTQRNIPNIVRGYELEVDEKALREVMRNKFSIHTDTLDVPTIDVMCWKGASHDCVLPCVCVVA